MLSSLVFFFWGGGSCSVGSSSFLGGHFGPEKKKISPPPLPATPPQRRCAPPHLPSSETPPLSLFPMKVPPPPFSPPFPRPRNRRKNKKYPKRPPSFVFVHKYFLVLLAYLLLLIIVVDSWCCCCFLCFTFPFCPFLSSFYVIFWLKNPLVNSPWRKGALRGSWSEGGAEKSPKGKKEVLVDISDRDVYTYIYMLWSYYLVQVWGF